MVRVFKEVCFFFLNLKVTPVFVTLAVTGKNSVIRLAWNDGSSK